MSLKGHFYSIILLLIIVIIARDEWTRKKYYISDFWKIVSFWIFPPIAWFYRLNNIMHVYTNKLYSIFFTSILTACIFFTIVGFCALGNIYFYISTFVWFIIPLISLIKFIKDISQNNAK